MENTMPINFVTFPFGLENSYWMHNGKRATLLAFYEHRDDGTILGI